MPPKISIVTLSLNQGSLHFIKRRFCPSSARVMTLEYIVIDSDSADESYAPSEAGNKKESARWLMRALATRSESPGQRPFWGRPRRLASNGPQS